MTVIGRKQSPRVLLQGWTPADEAVLTPLFPTVRSIRRLSEVDQGDWDALIVPNGLEAEPEQHVFVLAFGGRVGTPQDRAGLQFSGTALAFAAPVLSHEFIVPDDLEDGLRPLVDAMLQTLADPPFLGIVEISGAWKGTVPPRAVTPFLASRTGFALAGRFVREGGTAECWAIPKQAADPQWVVAALRHWSAINPDRFPSDPDWKHAPQWRTPAEIAADHELESVEAEQAGVLAALELRRAEIRERLTTLRDQADTTERALLSEQSQPLVAAVVAAISTFGFQVRDMDAEYETGPKREDLQVSEPDSDWTALVEVKGHKDGAKTNDLGKFVRYVELFMKQSSRPPDAKWYVVNQFRGTDPAMRPPPLRGAEGDVEVFADANGLICDTRDLLRLWLDVQSGRVSPEEARSALRGARGVFGWPAVETTNG